MDSWLRNKSGGISMKKEYENDNYLGFTGATFKGGIDVN
jgi:hypothetical protein